MRERLYLAMVTDKHRRRIKTEEKAKVLAAVWGQNLFNSLPRELFCAGTILKNRMNSSFTSNHPGAIHPILQIVLVQNSYSTARNLINSVPHTAATTFAFSSVFILLLWLTISCIYLLGSARAWGRRPPSCSWRQTSAGSAQARTTAFTEKTTLNFLTKFQTWTDPPNFQQIYQFNSLYQ